MTKRAVVTSAVVLLFVSSLSTITVSYGVTSSPTFQPGFNRSNDANVAKFPNVQNSGSNVYVVWEEGAKGVFFRSSPDNGTTWSPALTSPALRLSSKGTAQAPLMAAFGPNVFVTWAQTSGIGTQLQVYLATSTNFGISFGTAIAVDPNSSASEITPTIAATGSAVYVAFSANSTSLVATSTNNGTSFGPSFTYSEQHEPQVASVGTFGYIIADGTSLYVTTNNGATWTKKTIKGCCSAEPWIEASGSNVIATWETKGTASQVYVTSSQNNGKTWSKEFLLSGTIPKDWAPMLGIQNNTAVIAWRTNPDSTLSQEYVSNSLNGGLTWSTPTAIGVYGLDNEWPFTVSISGNSTYIMWSENTNGKQQSTDWQTLAEYGLFNGTDWNWAPLVSVTGSNPNAGAQREQDTATGAISSFGTNGFAAWETNSTTPQIYFSVS
jgi:hypothetical protein